MRRHRFTPPAFLVVDPITPTEAPPTNVAPTETAPPVNPDAIVVRSLDERIDTAKKAGRSRCYWDKEMGCLVEIRDGMNSEGLTVLKKPDGVIPDIKDYIAVGIQDPNRPRGHGLPITGGRRQHRDELRARGLIEVGNEKTGWSAPPTPPPANDLTRESLARSGYFDGARTIRELRRKQFR